LLILVKINIEAEIDGSTLIITECPWGRGELREPFIVKKWEIVKGGIAAQIDNFMKTQLIPAKEELKELKAKQRGDSQKNIYSNAILRKTKDVLKNIKVINESTREAQ